MSKSADQHSRLDPMPPAAELGRRERKKRALRRRIYQAAFELFLEKGFEETTVEEIADRADVAKGTVFNYFPRKTSFLAAVADDWTSRLVEELGPVEGWSGTTREKLERAFLFLTDLAVQNPGLSRLAFFESLRHMHSPWNEGRITDEEPVRQFLAISRSVLRQGQLSGEIRPDVEPEHAATLIESAFFRTLVHWLQEGGSVDGLHDEISGKLDIIFEGVAA
ncbi:MAG: TetR/AcrR family transcriptional regulator [Gemmatimonadota bacterium]|nr:MAG: TetR/AcrR family transcriptional regulator [Gemmatimonadota bacterium]